MDRVSDIVGTLKRALKVHGYTYADVALHLKLSEISVKRMFSTQSFSLKRINAICAMMDMDMVDLIRLYDENRHRISHLTIEQEQELSLDKRLLLVAICARNHWTFDDIIHHFKFTKAELYKLLVRLEEIKLLEMHPNDRIRLIVADDYRWLSNGPLEKMFERHLFDEFIHDEFSEDDSVRLYLHGHFTEAAKETLLRRIEGLTKEFSHLLKDCRHEPIARRRNLGLMIAMRNWEPEFVLAQRRE